MKQAGRRIISNAQNSVLSVVKQFRYPIRFFLKDGKVLYVFYFICIVLLCFTVYIKLDETSSLYLKELTQEGKLTSEASKKIEVIFYFFIIYLQLPFLLTLSLSPIKVLEKTGRLSLFSLFIETLRIFTKGFSLIGYLTNKVFLGSVPLILTLFFFSMIRKDLPFIASPIGYAMIALLFLVSYRNMFHYVVFCAAYILYSGREHGAIQRRTLLEETKIVTQTKIAHYGAISVVSLVLYIVICFLKKVFNTLIGWYYCGNSITDSFGIKDKAVLIIKPQSGDFFDWNSFDIFCAFGENIPISEHMLFLPALFFAFWLLITMIANSLLS
jgi:hypothetical protein